MRKTLAPFSMLALVAGITIPMIACGPAQEDEMEVEAVGVDEMWEAEGEAADFPDTTLEVAEPMWEEMDDAIEAGAEAVDDAYESVEEAIDDAHEQLDEAMDALEEATDATDDPEA